MCWRSYLVIPVLMAVFLGLCSYPLPGSAAPPEAGDRLTVSGFVADAQGKGVKEVEIELLVNGSTFTPRAGTSGSKPVVKEALWDAISCPRGPCRRPR